MDQGSTRKRSAVHNFAPTVTRFCVMWEGQALPHDTKFGNSRCEIVGRRVIFIRSLIHGLSCEPFYPLYECWQNLSVVFLYQPHHGRLRKVLETSVCGLPCLFSWISHEYTDKYKPRYSFVSNFHPLKDLHGCPAHTSWHGSNWPLAV